MKPKSYYKDVKANLRFRFCDISHMGNIKKHEKSAFQVILKDGIKINFAEEQAREILSAYDMWYDFLDGLYGSAEAAPEREL